MLEINKFSNYCYKKIYTYTFFLLYLIHFLFKERGKNPLNRLTTKQKKKKKQNKKETQRSYHSIPTIETNNSLAFSNKLY